MNDPIRAYVDQVGRHLRARGPARRQALDDLAAALHEDGPDAVAEYGPAEAYAATLDAELGTDRRFTRLLGVPNSLAPGVLQRMAATFDPADERVVVPHVLGIGWAPNVGALAVRLGLLNADDLDDELLADAAAGPGRMARRGAGATTAAAGVATAYAVVRKRRAGMPGSTVAIDAIGAASVLGLAVALVGAGRRAATSPGQRLVAPAYATLFAAAVAADGLGVGRDGQAPTRAGLLGLGIGAVAWFASTYGPVRATVRQRLR